MDPRIAPFVDTILKGIEDKEEVIMEIEYGYTRQIQLVKLNMKDGSDVMKASVTIDAPDYFEREFDFRDMVFALIQGRLKFVK